MGDQNERVKPVLRKFDLSDRSEFVVDMGPKNGTVDVVRETVSVVRILCSSQHGELHSPVRMRPRPTDGGIHLVALIDLESISFRLSLGRASGAMNLCKRGATNLARVVYNFWGDLLSDCRLK